MSGPAIRDDPGRRWVIFRARRAWWAFDPEELLVALPPALLAVALRRGKRLLQRRRYALPAPLPTLDCLLPPPRRRKRGSGTTAPPGHTPQGSPSG